MNSTFKGTPTYDLPELPAGLKWDTTELLLKTGVLRIVEDLTGIDGIAADEEVSAEVYTLGGQKVGTVTSSMSALQNAVKSLGAQKGTYIIKARAKVASGTMKLVVE